MVLELVRSAAEHCPAQPILADGSVTHTAADLWDYIRRLAAVTADAPAIGDRVAIIAERDAATARLVIGLVALGRVPLVVDPRRDDVDHRLQRFQPRLVLDATGERGLRPDSFDEQVLQADPREPVAPARTDHAYAIFTSGTTATSKAVITSQHGLAQGAADWIESYGTPDPDSGGVLQFAGSGFDIFYADLVRALAGRYRLYMCPEDVRVNPAELVALLRSERIGIVEFAPALGRLVLDELEEGRHDLPHLHQLAFGGEAWRVSELRRIRRLLPGRRVINTYGLVETTVDNFSYDARDDHPDLPGEQIMPIGRPFRHCATRIVDPETGSDVADRGELWIGGDYVAVGYLEADGSVNRSRLAVEHDGRPWFPTGDLVRRDGDGVWWYLGRAGSMVKLHGQRVELEAIDAVITARIGASACVTTLLADHDNALVTLVVAPSGPVDVDGARAAVIEALGPIAAPSAIIAVDTLPLNPNGKLDRPAIAVLAGSLFATTTLRSADSGPPAEQHTPMAVIRQFCRAELGLTDVSVDAHVADVGLDSLLLIKLLAELGRQFDCRLPAELVFGGPTPTILAAAVEAHRHRSPPAVARESRQWYPLTHAQQELLLHSALHQDPAAYTVPLVVEYTGDIDLVPVRRALAQIVTDHEPLRSRYTWSEQGWRAIVVDPVIELKVIADAGIDDLLRRPFDLAVEPPIRAWWLTPEPQRHQLVLALHHVATDGVSGQILLDELAARAADGPSPAPPTVTFGDLAAAAAGSPNQAHLTYWRDLLADAPVSVGRDPALAGAAHRLYRRLDATLERGLRRLAGEERTTVFALLLTAVSECERRWTDSDDVLIGYPISRRETADSQRLIGMFVDTAVARFPPSRGVTARQALVATRAQLERNGRHLGPACQQVLQERTRGTGRPAFACWLNLIGAKDRPPLVPGATAARVVDTGQLPAIFDRTFYVYDDSDGLEIVAVAAPGTPPPVAAARVEQLVAMLEHIAAFPDRRLASADLSGSDRSGSAETVTLVGPPWPAATVAEFATLADERPERPALRTTGRTVSYLELRDLVQHHRAQGRTGLLEMTRSVESVAALLAALGEPGLVALWDPHQPTTWRESYLRATKAIAGDGATGTYCLPTSGTSGLPTPVVSDVPTLLHVLNDYRQALAVTEADRFILLAGLAHDPVLRDVLAPLLIGASLWIPDDRQWRSPPSLVEVMREAAPTILNLTPQLARLIVDAADGRALVSVTRIVVAGDALRPGDLAGLRTTFPAAVLFNGYGLTQTPQLVALGRIPDDAAEIVIGPARPGSSLVVVDTAGRRCGLGQPGEIVVHSQFLASGLQAPVVSWDPSGRPVRRLATGDRGELIGDGRVRFLGRCDESLLVNGQLLDARLIDAILMSHPCVSDAATQVITDAVQDRLVSAVTVSSDVTERQLGAHVRRHVPLALAPTRIIAVPVVPRGANGKVDRRALAELLANSPAPAPRSALPHTTIQRAIAEVWRRHLRSPAVGVEDNFFDIGGTSLLLLRVHADLAKLFAAVPDVTTLYERPTIAELAAELESASIQQRSAAPVRQRLSRASERERRAAARARIPGTPD